MNKVKSKSTFHNFTIKNLLNLHNKQKCSYIYMYIYVYIFVSFPANVLGLLLQN